MRFDRGPVIHLRRSIDVWEEDHFQFQPYADRRDHIFIDANLISNST